MIFFFLQVQRGKVESHLQFAMRRHLDLACVKLSDTQAQLNSTQEELNTTREELKETIRKLEEKFNSTQEEFKETTRKRDERFNDLENKLMQCPDVYTWKITGFNEVLRQAKTGKQEEIASIAFYNCGYKFKISLNPNGHGSGKDTHLSIFFHLMKGEYDAILPWPFKKRITFTLIDQHENVNDRENIVMSLRANPENMECFVRPVTDENSGMGFDFISHNKLMERRYIVDDTLFFQVQVAPPQ